MKEAIPVADMFYSIAGEGSIQGRPMVFLRLQGCNLKCAWCDTPETQPVMPRGSYSDPWAVVGELHGLCDKHGLHRKDICITGGEPFFHESELLYIIQIYLGCLSRQKALDTHVYIETNGSYSISATVELLRRAQGMKIHHIIDLKCPSSRHAGSFNEDILGLIDPAMDEIKIVINDLKDWSFAREWLCNLSTAFRHTGIRVFIQPTVGMVQTVQNVARLVDDFGPFCAQVDSLDVRISGQLHKFLQVV